MRSSASFITTGSLGLVAFAAIAATDVPKEAKDIVLKVHAAAGRKDAKALEPLMVGDFVWSFGGDGDAKQALDAWKEDPAAFAKLYRVTGMPCVLVEGNIIECPKNAGLNYRAGFKLTDKGWRMIYFVAGD